MQQQVENMDRRMLEAMRGAMSSSNSRQTQAKAVRGADEEMNAQNEQLAQQNMMPNDNSNFEQQ